MTNKPSVKDGFVGREDALKQLTAKFKLLMEEGRGGVVFMAHVGLEV